VQAIDSGLIIDGDVVLTVDDAFAAGVGDAAGSDLLPPEADEESIGVDLAPDEVTVVPAAAAESTQSEPASITVTPSADYADSGAVVVEQPAAEAPPPPLDLAAESAARAAAGEALDEPMQPAEEMAPGLYPAARAEDEEGQDLSWPVGPSVTPMMGHDFGTFLGGMPLALPPAGPPESPFGRVQVGHDARPQHDEEEARRDEAVAVGPADGTLGEDDQADAFDAEEMTGRGDSDAGTAAPAADAEDDFGLELTAEDETTPPQAPPAAAPAQAAAPAPAAAAAVDAPRRPTPPPPARQGQRGGRVPPPARPPAGAFDFGGPTADPGVPAAGPAGGRGHLTTAFDGLAFGPAGETDVFSQVGTPPDELLAGAFGQPSSSPPPARPGPAAAAAGVEDEEAGGEWADELGLGPDEAAPGEGEVAGERTSEQHDGDLEFSDEEPAAPPAPTAAAPAPAARPRGAPRLAPAAGRDIPRRPPPPSQPGPSDPSARPQPPAKPKRRRWFGLRFMLVLMLLCMAATAATLWFLHPGAQAVVRGELAFDRKLDETERRELESRQIRHLQDPVVRQVARGRLQEIGPRVAPGFLGPGQAEAKAYDKVVLTADIPATKSALVLTAVGMDEEGDRLRMAALLDALYAENKDLRDGAAELRSAYEQAAQQLRQIEQKIEDRKRDRTATQGTVGATDPREQKRIIDKLEDLRKTLWQDYSKAVAEVQSLNADLERAEASGAAPQPEGGAGPDGGAAEPAAAVEKDPQVVEMARKLAALKADLARKQGARDAEVRQAGAAVDAAMQEFDEQIRTARGEAPDESALSKYLASVQRVQNEVRRSYQALSERQKGEYDRLAEMKRGLADKKESLLKESWGNDPELTRMDRELAIKQRQYGAAVGGELDDEAAKLKAQIDQLTLQIDDRRALLATATAPDIEELERFIDASLARLETERAKDDKRMQKLLADLSDEAAPALAKLPAEQKKLAAGLERGSQAVNAARAQYAAAVEAAGEQAAAEAEKLQTEAAQLEAALDARRTQLAAATRKTLTQQEQRARAAEIEGKRQALAAAEQAEADANRQYLGHFQKVLDAKAVLDHLKLDERQHTSAADELMKLEAERQDQAERVAAAKAAADRAVVPLPPGENSVSSKSKPDPRQTYIIGSLLGVALVFTLLIMFTARAAPATAEPYIAVAAYAAAESAAHPAPARALPASQGHRYSGLEEEEPVAV
jgi:hypothetical protein